MIAFARKTYILDSLAAKGAISLKETAKELGVAEITVRRDFEKLEAEGKLKRVQGGAAILDDPDGAELTMISKLPQHTAEKEKAAQYAAALVQDGENIFLDGGTSLIPLASILCKRRIRIVTHNTLILQQVSNPVAEIILIGG
ncbi:MAG: DeoR/GlpR family DNA-binding transcription regulator, partial [Oscillospiraceae bacterium]|nr:DeoR/GlpR family DNA-binding transcription regulator [Oscillospiraceae bacterium]